MVRLQTGSSLASAKCYYGGMEVGYSSYELLYPMPSLFYDMNSQRLCAICKCPITPAPESRQGFTIFSLGL